MQTSDLNNFTELWSHARQLNGRTDSGGVVAMAFKILARYEFTDVKVAIERHLADPNAGNYAMAPSDICALIDGRVEQRAMESWRLVERAIVEIGAAPDAVFDDAIIHIFIEANGGWAKVATTPDDESLKFMGIRFAKVYGQYQAKQGDFEYPGKLTGTDSPAATAAGYGQLICHASPRTSVSVTDARVSKLLMVARHLLAIGLPAVLASTNVCLIMFERFIANRQ